MCLMIICSKCGKEKKASDFYRKNSKIIKPCKQCFSENALKWKRLNPQKVKRYQKISNKRHYKSYYVKYVVPWRNKNRVKVNRWNSEWRKRNSQRMAISNRAAYHVRKALRKGTLRKPEKCQSCGRNKPLDASHSNYRFPLRVKWLCRECHCKYDKNNPKTLICKI